MQEGHEVANGSGGDRPSQHGYAELSFDRAILKRDNDNAGCLQSLAQGHLRHKANAEASFDSRQNGLGRVHIDGRAQLLTEDTISFQILFNESAHP